MEVAFCSVSHALGFIVSPRLHRINRHIGKSSSGPHLPGIRLVTEIQVNARLCTSTALEHVIWYLLTNSLCSFCQMTEQSYIACLCYTYLIHNQTAKAGVQCAIGSRPGRTPLLMPTTVGVTIHRPGRFAEIVYNPLEYSPYYFNSNNYSYYTVPECTEEGDKEFKA